MKRTVMLFLALFIEMTVPFIRDLSGDDFKTIQLSRDPHFRLLMENPSVRVWMMELGPDDKSNLVYREHDFLQIPLDEVWMSASIEGKQAVPFWSEKKPRFVRGGFSEVVQNTGKIRARVVEVEFIRRIGVEKCGPEAQISCSCWGAVGGIITQIGCTVLQTDDFTINQLEANPGQKVGLAVVPVLVVPIDSIKTQQSTSRSGEVMWVDRTAQTIESLDQHATAKAVTVEFRNH
jgi:hypothetical protein